MKRFGLFLLMTCMLFIIAACDSSNDVEKLEHGTVTKEKSEYKDFDSMKFVANDYDVEIHYPHFGVKNIDKNIEETRDRELKDFEELVKKEENDNEASLRVVFNPHDVSGEIFMFNVTKTVKVNPETDYSHHGILAVNTKSEQVALSGLLFDIEPTTREALFYRLDQAIEDNPALKPYYDDSKLERRIMDISKPFSKVDFKGDEVQFHFEQQEIGSDAMGTPTIELPFDDVVKFLEPRIKAVVEGESVPSKDAFDSLDGEEVDESNNFNSEDGKASHPIDDSKKMVALTFDDGPDEVQTSRVLDILKAYDARATFFMLGSAVDTFPDTVKAVDAAGHEIANHSYTHSIMTTLPVAEVQDEIDTVNNKVKELTGETPRFFRPPFGEFTPEYEDYISLESAYWSLDTEDWKNRDSQMILNNVQEEVRDGSIILMHDIHPTTVDSLDSVLNYLSEEGYQFVTVSELVEHKGPEVLFLQ